jgi:hypothetical protein
MVCDNVPDDPRKWPSVSANVAVIVYGEPPAESEAVEQVADAPDKATLAQIVKGLAELLGVAVNVTDPAGTPEPLPDGETVAVKVTLTFES